MEESKKYKSPKLGELLLREGLITEKQVHEALEVQYQTHGRLGSILVDLGYIDSDRLLSFFGRQFGVKTATLGSSGIDLALLKKIPFNKLKDYKVLPMSVSGKNMTLAMVNPKDVVAISDLEFLLGFSIQPVLVLQSQMDKALKMLDEKRETVEPPAQRMTIDKLKGLAEFDRSIDLKSLLRIIVKENASDLLLSAGAPPSIKKDNELKRLSTFNLTPEQTRQYAKRDNDRAAEEGIRIEQGARLCLYLHRYLQVQDQHIHAAQLGVHSNADYRRESA